MTNAGRAWLLMAPKARSGRWRNLAGVGGVE